MRLSAYPYVVVRLACDLCGRTGSYRLARLAAKYGAEIALDELIDLLAADCTARRSRREIPKWQWRDGCAARFVDVEGPQPPPDVPPALRRPHLVSDTPPETQRGPAPPKRSRAQVDGRKRATRAGRRSGRRSP